jgi:hypothetical protein
MNNDNLRGSGNYLHMTCCRPVECSSSSELNISKDRLEQLKSVRRSKIKAAMLP